MRGLGSVGEIIRKLDINGVQQAIVIGDQDQQGEG
jgi:hypothetical protein